ncbi:hypothetical protein SAMN05421595_1849 [Austwickia chelonae]|uniref:ATP synthase protein I n=1 Tax=Austwickia chelonae NBRC 105200 TaxID=1184607 RepID=K6W4I3_9MICO|nr:hypothetical protein [Austwickia chelonae]GAB76717.1 hypothetical protein AUCHE_02_00780 [Austwickia chelonae NBRC 105200]SEW29725.1 hypothetical protein SAMN05421595_1849 [Austwickia chelonae]
MTVARVARSVFSPGRVVLIWGALASTLVGLVGATAGFLVAGVDEAISAAAGTLLVAAFFASGALALEIILKYAESLALMGALAVYGTQVSVLYGLYDTLDHSWWLRGKWFAAAALVEVVVWQCMHVLAVLKTRTLIYSVPLPTVESR